MAFLNFFSKTKPVELARLSSGSITVDRHGTVVTSTLPHAFPKERIKLIADTVLKAFQQAKKTQLVFTELQIQFPALKLTARELKGGALIFITPTTPAYNPRA